MNVARMQESAAVLNTDAQLNEGHFITQCRVVHLAGAGQSRNKDW
jgi:hypothetical protein